MFKKSKRRIVVAIMSVLVILWVGTLSIIYTSSYFEMAKQNKKMLQAHAEMYVPTQKFDGLMLPNKPAPDDLTGLNPGFDPKSPKFQLSIFYTVAIADDGQLLEIINEPPTVHSDEELLELAQSVMDGEKQYGTEDNLAYYIAYKGGYTLVTFMNNTVVNENARTLLRYTLIFGGIAFILFFFLSMFLAKKIVDPLEESYHKQKQFISDASHELKTPVSIVNANAELLSREIGDNQWLNNIQYENERMGILIGQLLELARTEALSPQMEPMNFSRLVAGEVLPFESVVFEKQMVLNSNISKDIEVEGNPTQLKQVVSILLDNAIRHSEEQGEVWITLTKEHKVAKLFVINKGNEIPEEQRAQIFERFYRVDTARNSEKNHYGLGLAIAKAILTSHKGKIEVHCANGLVKFEVQIPLKIK